MSADLPTSERIDLPDQIASVESSQRLRVFACGSYHLCDGGGSRTGRVSLCDPGGRVLAQTKETAGVLDLKWGIQSEDTISAALSDGTIAVYDVGSNAIGMVDSVSIPDEGLFLSLDVGRYSTVVSTQAGSILCFDVSSTGTRLLNKNHDAHVLLGESVPVWTVGMSSHDNDIICSGGDDMSFKLWDLRCFESPTSIVSKSYMAGVTCVKFPPSNEHSLMVGSYDEHLKLWDLRYLKKPTLDINAGGGVWRIKIHPIDASIVLVACMHNGTNIYKFNSDESVALNVLQYPSVATDNLLAYGADWSPLSYCGETCSFITSSFYENYVDIVAFLSPQ